MVEIEHLLVMQHFRLVYTWVERGTVRVKRLAQEHNTMSPASARTGSARSRVEHANHEATAPPTKNKYDIIHQKFELHRIGLITWPNIPQLKLGNIRDCYTSQITMIKSRKIINKCTNDTQCTSCLAASRHVFLPKPYCLVYVLDGVHYPKNNWRCHSA